MGFLHGGALDAGAVALPLVSMHARSVATPRPVGGQPGLRWLLLVGLWTLPGVLAASQTYLARRLESEPIAYWQALVSQLPGWYYWAIATPVILRVGARLPLDRARWRRHVAPHLALALVVALGHVSVAVALKFLMPVFPLPAGLAFGTLYLRYLAAWLHFDLLTYGAILGIGHALDYARALRERELRASQLEAQLAQARLQALRMQLNPHFLFNALNTIAMLVREQETKTAVRTIAGLSDLLRHVLDDAGPHEVPLREELGFLERYLRIEQIRFGDRLRVEMRVDPETLDARVPHLILQPLVENALRHGLARRADAGRIEIVARREDASLTLEVRDDGPGLDGRRGDDGPTGVGLANTRARLAQLYGPAHRLDVRNGARGGVVASLSVPFALSPASAAPEDAASIT